MTPQDLIDHCPAKPGAWRDNPFDPEWPVAKVGDPGRILALVNAGEVGVEAAYSREVADEKILDAVDESYALVVARMPEKRRPPVAGLKRPCPGRNTA